MQHMCRTCAVASHTTCGWPTQTRNALVGNKPFVPPQIVLYLRVACADRDAQVLDFIHFNRRAALNSSLKHSACSYLPPKDAVAADEAIHMYPFDLSPQCEVSRAGKPQQLCKSCCAGITIDAPWRAWHTPGSHCLSVPFSQQSPMQESLQQHAVCMLAVCRSCCCWHQHPAAHSCQTTSARAASCSSGCMRGSWVRRQCRCWMLTWRPWCTCQSGNLQEQRGHSATGIRPWSLQECTRWVDTFCAQASLQDAMIRASRIDLQPLPAHC